MSRKIILAIAAVATLAISAIASTDASARMGGGGGGGHVSGGHSSFSRTSFHPGNVSIRRNIGTVRTNVFRPNRINLVRNPRLPHPPHFRHHQPHFAWWNWCRHHHHHHHHHCHRWYPPIGIGVYSEPVVVADAARYVAPAASVCTDCDYFLNDASGCYMAKRKFSTPQGDELRCIKICDDATDVK